MRKARNQRFDFFLQEMHDAIKSVLRYTEGMSYSDFTTNQLVRDAVTRNFEVMGESVRHIPYKFQRLNKHIPWQHMFDLRNFIVHEFFDLDDEILWQIIFRDLEKNLHDLKVIQEKLQSEI